MNEENVKRLADVKADAGNMTDLGKLMGKRVVTVEGYASHEFGRDTPVFKLSAIVFEDGTRIHVDGEHDCPYLPCDSGGLSVAQLNSLYIEENGE